MGCKLSCCKAKKKDDPSQFLVAKFLKLFFDKDKHQNCLYVLKNESNEGNSNEKVSIDSRSR